MRRISLPSEKILVPGEYELGNESILQIYFRVFCKGNGGDLPPIIVARSDIVSTLERQTRLNDELRLNIEWGRFAKNRGSIWAEDTVNEAIQNRPLNYQTFEKKIAEAPYYLIDGNHRSAAATLTHRPIQSLELQGDDDFEEIRRMIETGELFGFSREEESLRGLVLGFEQHILGDWSGGGVGLDNFKTVKERVDLLVSAGELPQYMIDYYKKGSK